MSKTQSVIRNLFLIAIVLILICGGLPLAKAKKAESGRAKALPSVIQEGRGGAQTAPSLIQAGRAKGEGAKTAPSLTQAARAKGGGAQTAPSLIQALKNRSGPALVQEKKTEGEGAKSATARQSKGAKSATARQSKVAKPAAARQSKGAKSAAARQSKGAKPATARPGQTAAARLNNSKKNNQNPVKSAGQKNQKLKEYLWKGVNIFQPEKNMALHFFCGLKNKISVSFIPSKPAPKGAGSAIVRVLTGNVPPSGKGYKEFIYVAEFVDQENKFYVKKQELSRFMRGLLAVRDQAFKNEETAKKEYQEKAAYCERQPEDAKQQCFSSSSGYQPGPPSILIELDIEGSAGKEFVSALSAYDADNIKNFCQ